MSPEIRSIGNYALCRGGNSWFNATALLHNLTSNTYRPLTFDA